MIFTQLRCKAPGLYVLGGILFELSTTWKAHTYSLIATLFNSTLANVLNQSGMNLPCVNGAEPKQNPPSPSPVLKHAFSIAADENLAWEDGNGKIASTEELPKSYRRVIDSEYWRAHHRSFHEGIQPMSEQWRNTIHPPPDRKSVV